MATGKKGKSLIPDPRSLASEHHTVIVSCLGFLATKSVSSSNPVKVLIIGLGGGSLPRFIDHHLTNVGGLTRPIGGHWVKFLSVMLHTVHGYVWYGVNGGHIPGSYSNPFFPLRLLSHQCVLCVCSIHTECCE